MFIGSMFLFSVLCLGTGFAKNGVTLDVLCGVLGIFSASAVPPAQGILGTVYDRPSPRKNKAFGCFSAGNPLGFGEFYFCRRFSELTRAVFGTILSGLFTQVFSWRAGFFFIAITYFLTTIVAALTVPVDTMPKQKFDEETFKRLDLPGTGMTIAGIGMFCAALRYVRVMSSVQRKLMKVSLAGDAPSGWKTPYVLVLLILGLLLIAAFIVWEKRYPYAIVDMNVFKDRDFSLVSILRVNLQCVLTKVAACHPVLWISRFSSTNILAGTLLSDRAWLLCSHDWCAYAAHGCGRLAC